MTRTARYFALHGKRYNEIPPHGVNRQAAFGHEVWQIVDAQNRLILQARPAALPRYLPRGSNRA